MNWKNINWYLVGFIVIVLLWAVPAVLAKVRRNRSLPGDDQYPEVKRGNSVGGWVFLTLTVSILLAPLYFSITRWGPALSGLISRQFGKTEPEFLFKYFIPYSVVLLVGIGVVVLAIIIFPYLFIFTKEYKANVLLNRITGSLRPVSAGLRPKLPWEESTGEIDMGINPIEVNRVFPIRGGKGSLIAKGNIVFSKSWSQLVESLKITGEITKERILGRVYQLLAQRIQDQPSIEEALLHLKEIGESVQADWIGNKTALEAELCVDIGTLQFTLEPDEKTAKQLADIFAGDTLAAEARTLQGIDPSLIEAAQIERGKVTRAVTEVRGAGDGNQIIAALQAIFHSFGGGGGGKGGGGKH